MIYHVSKYIYSYRNIEKKGFTHPPPGTFKNRLVFKQILSFNNRLVFKHFLRSNAIVKSFQLLQFYKIENLPFLKDSKNINITWD